MIFDKQSLQIIDERCPEDKIFNCGKPTISYTLLSDDITKGKKPTQTPYKDREDEIKYSNGRLYAEKTNTLLDVFPYEDGIILDMRSETSDISSFGINLPFNFMGKLNGGGWENQFLFNSPYSKNGITYAYLKKPNGNNLVVAILSEADGWKMDYSPYSFGHYFINLKLLTSFDRAYGTRQREKHLRIAILPVSDFRNCLERLSRLYELPFIDYDLSGGRVGDKIALSVFGEIDCVLETYLGKERELDGLSHYTLKNEGETTLTPIKNGKKGAEVSVFAYKSLENLYKRSMDSVDLDVIKAYTDSNLCEHQCWASAMLRFLMKHKDMLSSEEIAVYEKKLLSLLDIITEQSEEKAIPRITIFNKPQNELLAYNVFKSRRVQELAHGITILLDAYLYFGDEKYLTYAKGGTMCLISGYQRDDGRIEIDWGNSKEDYSTVCSPMIPICDMANYLKDKSKELSNVFFESAAALAEHIYRRGLNFPTEGCKSSNAETEMEDGSISCTALSLLYYCKNVKREEKYVKKAKEILNIHKSWIIEAPICQMKGSTLRWWETQWEGDADGPAICAGHAWTIWRAEADYLYYELTGEAEHLIRAKNGFMTNLSKIQEDGTSYSIYNPDMINGGGFGDRAENVKFQIAPRFASIVDCGISRYVWIRINDTLLQ